MRERKLRSTAESLVRFRGLLIPYTYNIYKIKRKVKSKNTMRICSLSVPRLKHEWNQTVWPVNNLCCGTAGRASAQRVLRSDLAQQSSDQNNFAGGAGLQDFLVCASRLGERQLLADDGAERAVLQAGDEPGVDFRHLRGLCRPQTEG